MVRFPAKEAGVIVFAEEIAHGLEENPGVYPSPPYDPASLTAALNAFVAARNASIEAHAAAQVATANKQEALRMLLDQMKSDLRYAETTVRFNDAKLKLIGWAAPKKRSKLKAPGQVRSLDAPFQGEGNVVLDWKAPVGGGRVAAYKIERRAQPEGEWADVAVAMKTEIDLKGQERGKQWEYRVIALNKTGEGPPSNTIPVVL